MPDPSLGKRLRPAERTAGWRFGLALGIACWATTSPLLADPGHRPVELSLFHPVSIARDPEASANFRLSLIQGRMGSVRGVDLNAVVGMLHRDLRGLQLTGAYSQIDGEARGILFTGGVSFLKGEGRGFQWAGLVNFNQARFYGVQVGGLLNYTRHGYSGVQFSSLFNLSDGDSRWVQASSISNVVAGEFRGVQLAGFYNFVVGDMTGIQIAGLNAATRFRGLQVGLANLSGDTRGVQIGAVNYTRRANESIPVGLVNLADNGGVDIVLFGSSFSGFNAGVRTTVNRWSSMFSAGGYHVPDERQDVAFLSWHYGYLFPLANRFSLGVDGGFVHVMPKKSSDPEVNDDLRFALQGRVLGEYRTSRKLAFFAAVGVSVEWARYQSSDTTTDPLFVGGISLF